LGEPVCGLDRVQPTTPIAETMGEESKPEPGAKRPPKPGEPMGTNGTDAG